MTAFNPKRSIIAVLVCAALAQGAVAVGQTAPPPDGGSGSLIFFMGYKGVRAAAAPVEETPPPPCVSGSQLYQAAGDYNLAMPPGCKLLLIELYGAQGGNDKLTSATHHGALGCYRGGTLAMPLNAAFTVHVGAKGGVYQGGGYSGISASGTPIVAAGGGGGAGQGGDGQFDCGMTTVSSTAIFNGQNGGSGSLGLGGAGGKSFKATAAVGGITVTAWTNGITSAGAPGVRITWQ